jgi:hypothetical protein
MQPLFKVGDVVIYNPPYPVDGKWRRYQENKQEFVVVRGNEEADADGVMFSNIVVSYMTYAGLDRHEIPYGKSYQLSTKSFYHAVPQHPSWEL